MKSVPTPLAMLLAVVALFGAAWAVMTPPWQASDEIAHFSYVQTIAENGELPGGTKGKDFSTQLTKAVATTNADATIFWTFAHPEWSRAKEEAWEEAAAGFPADDGGGANNASSYPPLYYLYEALPYLAAGGADPFPKLAVMRLASALWLLVTATAAWLLAGELFGRRRLPQLVAAATAGLWPMVSSVSASVNPDGLLYAASTLVLWLGVRLLRRGLDVVTAVAFGAVVGLALVVKAAALVLVPAAVGVIAYSAWRARRAPARVALTSFAAMATAAAPPFAWHLLAAADEQPAYGQATEVSSTADAFNPREFLSYLWQFYLPRLPFMTEVQHHVPVISDLPLMNTWIGTGWGVFGWVNVWWPAWVYGIFAGITALLAALTVRGLVSAYARRGPSAGGGVAAAVFLAGTALLTWAALHWTDYQWYATDRGLFLQGRYMLPLIGVFGAAVALAVDRLPPRLRVQGAAVWMGGLLAFQAAGLGLILTRWYA